MKKIFSTIAALGLVAGMATAASALEFSVSGEYQLEGDFLSNAVGAGLVPYAGELDTALGVTVTSATDGIGSDSFWMHTFVIRPEMKVNDKISMAADIRVMEDEVWGAQDDLATADGGNLNIFKIYMDYMSPIGLVRMGRTSDFDMWGTPFLSSDNNADRILWFPGFLSDPFSACLSIGKTVEGDAYQNTVDTDSDVYELSLFYKTTDLDLGLGYEYMDSALFSDIGAGSFDTETHRIKAYGIMNFGDIHVDSELSYDFGDWQDFDASAATDIDLSTFAFMINGTMQLGDDLDVGLLYAYASGDGDAGDDSQDAALAGTYAANGLGEQFTPLYVLTGLRSGIAVADTTANYPAAVNGDVATAGLHCICLYSDFNVSQQLSLHGAVAYAAAADTGQWDDLVLEDVSAAGAASLGDRDSDYGWEIDLGAAYKLLDNLTYELHFGYLFTGDFFQADAATPTAVGGATYLPQTDPDDVYLLSHTLTMTF